MLRSRRRELWVEDEGLSSILNQGLTQSNKFGVDSDSSIPQVLLQYLSHSPIGPREKAYLFAPFMPRMTPVIILTNHLDQCPIV